MHIYSTRKKEEGRRKKENAVTAIFSAIENVLTEILHQCQKPGFWLIFCIKPEIPRQKPGFSLAC
ncbi:MAG: hypothetical protein MUE44_11500 [Oscillatoriaceae cyanobacterium Prado104]|nr:hypothetical protein [Oscillatoriaceae cyanobacterium Prado104]